MSTKKIEETIIIRNNKMVYAVRLKGKAEDSKRSESTNPYVIVENGEIKFIENGYFGARTEFDFSNEVHKVSKEIFVSGLRTAIKQSILQLKQLQLVFEEMNLSEIRAMAQKETFELAPYITKIKDLIGKFPDGTSLAVPRFLIPQLIAYCDKNKIPMYHLTETTCSVADSYSQLLAYEESR